MLASKGEQFVKNAMKFRASSIFETTRKKYDMKISAVLVILAKYRGKDGILMMQRAKGTSYAGQLTFPGGAVEKSDRSNKLAALRETFEEIPGLRDHGIDVLDYEYPFGSEEFYKYDIRTYLAELQTEIDINELDFSRSEVSNLQFLDFDTLLKPGRVNSPSKLLNLRYLV